MTMIKKRRFFFSQKRAIPTQPLHFITFSFSAYIITFCYFIGYKGNSFSHLSWFSALRIEIYN